jgi:hemoglobin
MTSFKFAMVDMTDLTSRADIVRLVNAFYDRVRLDVILSSIFDGVARVDWEVHLPKMYDFWESVLFGRAAFKGNPLMLHRQLARRTPLTSTEFNRWIQLFQTSVDELFVGPCADEAKLRASRIALVMQHHIAADRTNAAPVPSLVKQATRC